MDTPDLTAAVDGDRLRIGSGQTMLCVPGAPPRGGLSECVEPGEQDNSRETSQQTIP